MQIRIRWVPSLSAASQAASLTLSLAHHGALQIAGNRGQGLLLGMGRQKSPGLGVQLPYAREIPPRNVCGQPQNREQELGGSHRHPPSWSSEATVWTQKSEFYKSHLLKNVWRAVTYSQSALTPSEHCTHLWNCRDKPRREIKCLLWLPFFPYFQP